MSSTNTQKVMRGISSQTFVTVLLGVVEIVSFSIMSRLLTQEDFGYYAAITAITTVFASFSETGIGSAIVQHKTLNERYTNNAFTLSLLFGLFISLLLIILAGPLSKAVIDSSMKVPLMIMSVTLLCNCLTSVNISLMQRKLQFLRIGVVNLISIVITTVVAIILAVKGYGYYSILTKAVLSSVLTLVISYFAGKTRFKIELDRNTFKSIFSFSGWLMASVFLRNFAQQADKLLMGRLLSVTALGTYNRPKEFINQISSKLNGIFDTALFPVLSSIQDEKTSMANAYRSSLYYMNIFSVMLMMGFVFNSELIIRIFLGEQWINISSLFIVLSLALLVNIDGRLVDCYFRSLGLTKSQFYFRIFELTINVIALLIGAHWDMMGIAVSIILSNTVVIVLKIIYLSSFVDVSIADTFLTMISSWRIALIIAPIMIAAMFFFPHSWSGNIATFLLYAGLSFVFFFVCPRFVGKRYKDEMHAKLINLLRSKIVIKK